MGINHLMTNIKPMKFSDQVRAAIESAPKSRYVIAAETGIDPATLSRFMHRKGGLSIEGLDLLAEFLGWSLNVTTEQTKPSTKKRS